MVLAPGTRLGPYEILSPLGSGGMGEVYAAKDARLDRTVAIKILPQHLADQSRRSQRFHREARVISRLSHPHICALYDVGEHDGVHFIVMEHLEGETLAERIAKSPLPLTQVLDLAIEMADALDHAHHAGIVHRDLKPANIMLVRTGTKLLDFGVARLREPEPADLMPRSATESLTEEGTVPGTLQFMSPEQLEGHEADARSDIFALGAVIYEMATGRHAFDGASRASVIAAILERDPEPLAVAVAETHPSRSTEAVIPALLEHVVSRCLAKNPDERWQTAADVRQELKWIAQGGSLVRVAPAASGVGIGRRKIVWIGVVGVVLAAAIYVFPRLRWTTGGSETSPEFTQLTFRRGNLTQARFAADGQTILYSAAWDGGPVQVFETRPTGPTSRALGLLSTGLEGVSSKNELALIQNCQMDGGFCTGTLARVPLAGGAPRPVLNDVVNAAWTADGSDLAVIHLAQGESRIEFPIGKPLYTSSGKLQWLAFSPAGDRLAFIEHPIIDEEVGVLKVVDLQGRVTTITSGWKTIRTTHWPSPGDEIWFSGSQKGKACSVFAVSLTGQVRKVLEVPGDVTLYDVGRDGRLLLSHGSPRARMMWSTPRQERDLSWFDWSTVADLSGDGKTVLFQEWGIGAGATPLVYSRDAGGGEAVRLGDGKALAFSPDGRWALALRETDRPQLVLLATGAEESRQLSSTDLSDVYWARWFPDGRRLLLVSTDAEHITRSHVLDIDTGRKTQLADPGSLAVLVSPDGSRVLVRDPLSGFDLWPAAGGEPAHVEGLSPQDKPIQWSKDRRFLFVRDADETSIRLFRFHLATGRREPWRHLMPQDRAGVIGVATGRGELAITPDGDTVAFTYWVLLDDLFLVEGVGPSLDSRRRRP